VNQPQVLLIVAAQPWEQHCSACGCCHDHADIAIGQILAGLVAGAKNRRADWPGGGTSPALVFEQQPIEFFCTPGASPQGREHHEGLQLQQQGRSCCSAARAFWAESPGALAQLLPLRSHAHLEFSRQPGGRAAQPGDVVVGSQLLELIEHGLAIPLAQPIGNGGDRTLIAVGGGECDGGLAKPTALLRLI